MAYALTTTTKKLLKLDKRLRGVAGGTSAGKTISILQILIDYAQSTKGELISVVSETFPHLRKGAMLDFENIMRAQGYWDDNRWLKTDHTYTFETGSKIEFFSADTTGKVHGPRRDVLFVNEANNIEYKIFDQLRVRTRRIIWADWNPSEEFWWYNEIVPNYDHDFVTVTYQDNEALDQTIIEDIESHKHNKNWWKVYGLGQLGEVEGRIYTGWQLLDEIPHEARLERRGLDFGYSHDPAAIVDVYYYNGGYILDERLYQKGMGNKALADFLKNMERPDTLTIADSAEPKSIDEIKEYGVGVVGADKGQGSLNRGILHMQEQRISITKRSVNGIKEYRKYMWKTDKEGNILKIPEGGNDHFLDAARYALESLKPREPEEEPVYESMFNADGSYR
jgi:phage terminase large subunit